jgi:hypothetical protein
MESSDPSSLLTSFVTPINSGKSSEGVPEVFHKLHQPAESLGDQHTGPSEKSVFQCYLEALRKKWHDTEDPYLLYEKTKSCNKDYNIYGMVSGFEFGNYTLEEDRKTFDITYDGRSETIVIWKDNNR